MYQSLILLIAATITLTSCQEQKEHNSQPSLPASVQPAETPAPPATAVHEIQATDTVAVKKEEESRVAASLQQSLKQSGESLQASALAGLSKSEASPAMPPKAQQAGKAVTETMAPPAPADHPAQPLPSALAAIKAPTSGDPLRGKALAGKCSACHNFTAIRKVGPGLSGVVGRKAGSMADMKYSSSLAAADWSWDESNLALWLCDTKAAIVSLTGNPAASTKMPSQRICEAEKQADLIAFLRTLK